VSLYEGESYYRLKIPVGPGKVFYGNSGGPVLDRSTGQVIGVVTRIKSVKGDSAYCVPVKSLATALEKLGDPTGWTKKCSASTVQHHIDLAFLRLSEIQPLCSVALKGRANLMLGRNPTLEYGGKNIASKGLVELFPSVQQELWPIIRAARDKIVHNPDVPQHLVNLSKNLINNYEDMANLFNSPARDAFALDRRANELRRNHQRYSDELERELKLPRR
jgi:hypothetical protein